MRCRLISDTLRIESCCLQSSVSFLCLLSRQAQQFEAEFDSVSAPPAADDRNDSDPNSSIRKGTSTSKHFTLYSVRIMSIIHIKLVINHHVQTLHRGPLCGLVTIACVIKAGSTRLQTTAVQNCVKASWWPLLNATCTMPKLMRLARASRYQYSVTSLGSALRDQRSTGRGNRSRDSCVQIVGQRPKCGNHLGKTSTMSVHFLCAKHGL